MAKNVGDIRNLAILGHGSSGKTTLVDHILVKTKAVNAHPSVDEGTSICDFDEEEKHHKYTIESTVTHFEHAGKEFNFIDTPGYPDLIGQAIGAISAVETALIAIDAHAGIKVNTRRVFSEATKAGLGRFIVITKFDAENVDFEGLLASIKEVFGSACVPLNVPLGQGHDFHGIASTLQVPDDTTGAVVDPAEIGESLIESIIEVDEAVMEKYFEGEMPSQEELARLMAKAISEGSLVPIMCVSVRKEIGVDELLDVLAASALPPDAISRTAKKDGEEVPLTADPAGPLAARVFKTRIDPFVQKLSFLRVYSGTLHKDMTVASPDARKGVKIGPLFKVQANHTEAIDEAIAGDIVAVTKAEDLHTGTSIGDLAVPRIKFPTPMVGLAVTPKSRGDEAKLSAPCTSSWKKTARFIWRAIRKRRRWC